MIVPRSPHVLLRQLGAQGIPNHRGHRPSKRVGSHPRQIGRQRRGASPKSAVRHAFNNFRFSSTPDLPAQLKISPSARKRYERHMGGICPEQFELPNGYSPDRSNV
jgi:hypothetical protein